MLFRKPEKTFLTSLPTTNHRGESTAEAIYRVLAAFRAGGVTYNLTPNCTGFWYEGADLYRDDTILIEMSGNEKTMRRALGGFGEDAEQYEVLFVERKTGFIAASGHGADAAATLAKAYGGATLTPGGVCFAIGRHAYRALVHGRDYVSTVTGATK